MPAVQKTKPSDSACKSGQSRCGTSATLQQRTPEQRQAVCEARARILKALAHPSRLLIVEELSQRECCVCELTALVGSDMSTVSRHLALLQSAGIIKAEKRGSWVWYQLSVPCILEFMGCIEVVIIRNAQQHEALLQHHLDKETRAKRTVA